MLYSLTNETRKYYHDPKFVVENPRDFIRVGIPLLARLIFNRMIYVLFGSYLLVIVAIEGRKEIVGVSTLNIKSYESFKTANFGIVVKDDWQGEGVGTILISRAIDIAERFGVNVIRLSVLIENAKAIKLYRKFDFVVECCHKRGDVWRGKIYDEYYMALHLS